MPVDDCVNMLYTGIMSANEFRDAYMERDLQDNKEKVWTYTTSDRTTTIDASSLTTGTIGISKYWTSHTYNDVITSEPKHFNCKRCGAPNQIDVCEYCGCAYEDD